MVTKEIFYSVSIFESVSTKINGIFLIATKPLSSPCKSETIETSKNIGLGTMNEILLTDNEALDIHALLSYNKLI